MGFAVSSIPERLSIRLRCWYAASYRLISSEKGICDKTSRVNTYELMKELAVACEVSDHLSLGAVALLWIFSLPGTVGLNSRLKHR